MLISAAFDQLVDGLHRRLPEAGFTDIRPAHCTGVFRVMDANGTRPSKLAQRAGVSPQAMAEFVRYLEERGYVTRRPDPTDGRGRIIQLTEKGVHASEAAGAAFTAIEAEWESRLGPRRMAELRRALNDLATEVEPS